MDMGFADMEETPSQEEPMTEEGAPEARDTVTIPLSMLGDREPREGETITMKVVATGPDGVEVMVSEAPGETGETGEDGYQEAGPQIDQMAAQNA